MHIFARILERDSLGLRLEQAVYALQQVLSLAIDEGDSECEAFLSAAAKLSAASD